MRAVRITGGEFRGRRLRVPSGDRVRPTQDRVREALFSMLAPWVGGASCLDLYAGTGAIGLEALSRGAARVVWVEQDRRTLSVLRDNVEALAGPGQLIFGEDALRWLRRGGCAGEVDIVFADPPYATTNEPGVRALLDTVSRTGSLRREGVVAVELSAKSPSCAVEGWDLWRDRVYGAARLAVYRPAAAAETEAAEDGA